MYKVDIPGVKEIEINGEPALAFGSFSFSQDDIQKISESGNTSGLLFYQATFENTDLSTLGKLPLKRITVLHGNFGDLELSQIEGFESLRLLKLHDTNISEDALREFLSKNPLVEIK